MKELNLKKLKLPSRILVIFICVLFAQIGLLFIFNSGAAPGDNFIEPETGILTHPAVVISNANASGGKYLQFNGNKYLFNDEFNGASNAQPDTSKWVIHDEKCDAPANYSCPKNANAFQDGNGNLVLRTRRESSNWLTGGPYSGSWISTFRYGYGWPATGVKATTPVPFKVEMRALKPNTPGAWPSLWAMNTDRSTSQNIYELDISEQRMTYPTSAGCHQHTWLNGSDIQAWDGAATVSNMAINWHLFSANVYTDRVEYYVDGISCGTSYGVNGNFGLILNNAIALPGSWGSGNGQPASSDPGPWDFLVDYVRVTKL